MGGRQWSSLLVARGRVQIAVEDRDRSGWLQIGVGRVCSWDVGGRQWSSVVVASRGSTWVEGVKVVLFAGCFLVLLETAFAARELFFIQQAAETPTRDFTAP
ncbi:hypothetical protein SO802_029068 [Lithocarpus litseifolius]|uniref:Uncharacterized protein n=1 Tax=Lithocarpus litseifolius TaxID=425828 RepID=A0AAW2BV93_9ROSI